MDKNDVLLLYNGAQLSDKKDKLETFISKWMHLSSYS